MIEANGELILSVSTDGYTLKKPASTIRGRHEAKHVDRDWVLTISRDYVGRKDSRPRQRVLTAKAAAYISIVNSALWEAQGCVTAGTTVERLRRELVGNSA